MILFLCEMKKTDTLIFPWNLLQTRIWTFDLLIPVSGSFPSHCTLSPVWQPASSHILLLPLTDAAKAKESPRQAAKRKGEWTDLRPQTLSPGETPWSPWLAWAPNTHSPTYKGRLWWGLKGKGIVSLNHSDFPNRVFPKLQPLTSYLYKFCCAYHLCCFYWIFSLKRPNFYLGLF